MALRAEIVVVGRGMVGAAATRHLAAAGHDVMMVGAPPPPPGAASDHPFSSHDDEGRVTRITAFAEPWARWAKASIERYEEIAARSGITFHDPVGLVVLAADIEEALSIGKGHGAAVDEIDRVELAARTGIDAGLRGHRILWEGAPAGLIHPRKLIEAQLACAALDGARTHPATVEAVAEVAASVHLRTTAGEIEADRVVLCTGAYGAALLGDPLPIERRLRTILLADIGAGPALPTLIMDDPPHDDLGECYWVPPVRYPDGRELLKIGGDSVPMFTASSTAEIGAWFREGGAEAEADALRELLERLLPDRRITWTSHKPCVVAYPPHGEPYLQLVSERVAVAFGGSGAAAKSSDEIGRLGAALVS